MEETNAAVTNVVTGVVDNATATPTFLETYGWTLFWVVVIGAAFAFLWYKGYLARFANYIELTREELRKCSWPTRSELWGSTVVVAISILLLGGFTVLVDFILSLVLHGRLFS